MHGARGLRTRAGACLTREGIGPNQSYRVRDAGRGRTVVIPARYWEGRKNYAWILCPPESLAYYILCAVKSPSHQVEIPVKGFSASVTLASRIRTKPARWKNKTICTRRVPASTCSGRARYIAHCIRTWSGTFPNRNASAPLRKPIVYGILYFVGGRPHGGWKMWPGCVCGQNTPTRFARIFGVCHTFATIPDSGSFPCSTLTTGTSAHPYEVVTCNLYPTYSRSPCSSSR